MVKEKKKMKSKSVIISALPLGSVLTGGFKPGNVPLIREGTGVVMTEGPE